MTTRALFSLSEDIMARLRDLVPSRQRSALVEALLRKELADRERARDRELEAIARRVETHADFADARLAAEQVDAIAGEGLE